MTFHPLKIRQVVSRIDGQAKTVMFDVPMALQDAFRWQAGQHITLSLTVDGQNVRRSYTISASPDTGEPLQMTVKRVKGGLVSNTINQYWREGETIDIASPSGDFVLTANAKQQRSHYFFGAGSGITPLWAMINSVLVAEPHSRCYLLYANRDDKHIIFKDELAELQATYPTRLVVSHVLSSPRWMSAFKYWQSGRLDSQKIAQFIHENPPYAQDAQYYICAPNELLSLIRGALQGVDVPTHRIHFETFGGSVADTSPIEGVYADLSANVYGQTHALTVQDNETLLEAMLNAGLHNVPYSCQSGVCGSCKAQLKQGQVAMKNRAALSDEDIQNGAVLTCQALCQTNAVSIEY